MRSIFDIFSRHNITFACLSSLINSSWNHFAFSLMIDPDSGIPKLRLCLIHSTNAFSIIAFCPSSTRWRFFIFSWSEAFLYFSLLFKIFVTAVMDKLNFFAIKDLHWPLSNSSTIVHFSLIVKRLFAFKDCLSGRFFA